MHLGRWGEGRHGDGPRRPHSDLKRTPCCLWPADLGDLAGRRAGSLPRRAPRPHRRADMSAAACSQSRGCSVALGARRQRARRAARGAAKVRARTTSGAARAVQPAPPGAAPTTRSDPCCSAAYAYRSPLPAPPADGALLAALHPPRAHAKTPTRAAGRPLRARSAWPRRRRRPSSSSAASTSPPCRTCGSRAPRTARTARPTSPSQSQTSLR